MAPIFRFWHQRAYNCGRHTAHFREAGANGVPSSAGGRTEPLVEVGSLFWARGVVFRSTMLGLPALFRLACLRWVGT